MQLHIKKFDPSGIASDKILVFIGKRGTGKTTCLKDMLFFHRDIPVGTVICPTEHVNPTYGDMIPGLFIQDEYTPQLLDNFVKRQKIIKSRTMREKKMYGKTSLDPRAFLILDDCLYDGCWKRDKNIRYLFMNGRHISCFLCITMQYALGVPPDLRTNIDYAFIHRENNFGNRRRIYENYASIFPTFEMFCTVLDQVTNDFGILVIDNTSRSNKIEDSVFWYEAEEHPRFTMGSKEFWQIHNQNASDTAQEEQEEELFDINAFRKTRSGPLLNVKKVF